ncbi:hypothetical protein PAPYR_12565 [Paratrimastix pyriformis]|uniref:Uncharacterized protein n=1 Tax=Paratrimastix pyriformis TaxID=342808 RepID=A0ABQ8U3Z0_9EUKA|nr:hypothetical protein PAPYR_12565 [Paratrimastix pyriformis]
MATPAPLYANGSAPNRPTPTPPWPALLPPSRGELAWGRSWWASSGPGTGRSGWPSGLYLLEALALDFLDRPAMVTAGAAACPPGGLVGLTLGLLRAHAVSALVEAACGLLAAAMAVLRLPPAEVGGGWW